MLPGLVQASASMHAFTHRPTALLIIDPSQFRQSVLRHGMPTQSPTRSHPPTDTDTDTSPLPPSLPLSHDIDMTGPTFPKMAVSTKAGCTMETETPMPASSRRSPSEMASWAVLFVWGEGGVEWWVCACQRAAHTFNTRFAIDRMLYLSVGQSIVTWMFSQSVMRALGGAGRGAARPNCGGMHRGRRRNLPLWVRGLRVCACVRACVPSLLAP